MYLGAHMSIAGGVHRALERGLEAGCGVVQIFTRNQTRWEAPPLEAADVRRFLLLKPAFRAVFAHSSYLINPAGPDPLLRGRAVRALAEELRRCRALGLDLLVLHPGFHLGAGIPLGLDRAASSLEEAVRRAEDTLEQPPARLLLEATSGPGSALGCRFEELRDLLDRLGARRVPAGVCLDTCHLFAAGYPIHEPEGYGRTMESLERVLGSGQVRAFHLNDSKGALGSRRDRHEHIGAGKIGLDGFRLLLADPRWRETPMCLETPKGKDLADDRRNLAVLRALRAPTMAPPANPRWQAPKPAPRQPEK